LNEFIIFALLFFSGSAFFSLVLEDIKHDINRLNIELCQAVKKERDIRWRRTSVRRDLEKTVTKRRSN
jgi:uncharacterized protein (DUF3084 family)